MSSEDAIEKQGEKLIDAILAFFRGRLEDLEFSFSPDKKTESAIRKLVEELQAIQASNAAPAERFARFQACLEMSAESLGDHESPLRLLAGEAGKEISIAYTAGAMAATQSIISKVVFPSFT